MFLTHPAYSQAEPQQSTLPPLLGTTQAAPRLHPCTAFCAAPARRTRQTNGKFYRASAMPSLLCPECPGTSISDLISSLSTPHASCPLTSMLAPGKHPSVPPLCSLVLAGQLACELHLQIFAGLVPSVFLLCASLASSFYVPYMPIHPIVTLHTSTASPTQFTWLPHDT